MKFVLLVEGQTETACIGNFLKRWLDPQLNQPVGIAPVKFNGWTHFEKEVAKKSKHYLRSPATDKIVAVIGLLDLYGPNFYPAHLSTEDQRHDWATDKFQKEVNDSRFRMYFAVHEFEAWLFSQSSILPQEIRSGIPGKASQPETINDVEPPSKLLKRLYRERLRQEYKKVTYGKNLFDKLDPEVAADKCPRLKTMLNEMLAMAKDAGL